MPLWETTMELEPDYLPAHLRRAEALLKLNRIEDAEAAFTIVKIKDIENPHAYQGLARVAIYRDDYQTAYEHLQKAMNYSKGNVGIQLIVTVMERLGEKERADAVRGMAKALEGYSDIPDPWIQDLMQYCYDPHQLITAAGLAVFAGDLDKAFELNSLAIKYDPDNGSGYFQLGTIYQGKKQFQEALTNFAKATSLNPRLSDAWLFSALVYEEMGNLEKCDELISLGVGHNPDSPALHLKWGERLTEKGRLDEAIPVLKRSIKLRPQEPEAYIALARIYMRRNELDNAQQFILQALEQEAANPIALSFITILSINQKDEEEARKWLKKIDLQPRTTDEVKQQLHQFFVQAFGYPPD
jgi:tetratricopeptide (TPR) repeat protein